MELQLPNVSSRSPVREKIRPQRQGVYMTCRHGPNGPTNTIFNITDMPPIELKPPTVLRANKSSHYYITDAHRLVRK